MLQRQSSGSEIPLELSPQGEAYRRSWRLSRISKTGLAVGLLALGAALAAVVTASLRARQSPLSRARSPSDHRGVEDAFLTCGGVFDRCGGSNFMGQPCCEKGCLCMPKDQYFSQCEPPAGEYKCDPDAVLAKAKVAQKHVEALNASAAAAWEKQAKLAETARSTGAKAAFMRRAEIKASLVAKKAREQADEKIQEGKKMWKAATDAAQERIEKAKANLAKLKADARKELAKLRQEQNATMRKAAVEAKEAKEAAGTAAKEDAAASAARDAATKEAEHQSWLVKESRKKSLPWLMAYADLVSR